MVKRIISCIVVVSILVGCVQRNEECTVCGEFSVVNFSKNEVNDLKNHEVSLRRNLTINAEVGEDYFTIWSWNPTSPDSSWTEALQKEVRISKSNLSIHENGTWSWVLNSSETYKSIPRFGGERYEIEREFTEIGTWDYVHGNDQFITLNSDRVVQNDQVIVYREDGNPEIIEAALSPDQKLSGGLKDGRRFEIVRNLNEDSMVLKTVEEAEKLNLESIDNASYSLTQGNVLLTLSEDSQQPKLAVKMTRF